MNDFVVILPCLRIALLVAIETMHLHIAGISFFLKLNFFAFSGSQQNKLAPIKNVLGCKVGQIRCWGIMYSI